MKATHRASDALGLQAGDRGRREPGGTLSRQGGGQTAPIVTLRVTRKKI